MSADNEQETTAAAVAATVMSDSEDMMMERPEASESGVITELEHERRNSVEVLPTLASDDSGTNNNNNTKKPKSGRRLKSVAKGIKKQFKSSSTTSGGSSSSTTTGGIRSAPSLETSSSQEQDPMSSDEEDEVDVSQTSTSKTKKKHKSKFKPVAKAAAKAAKKMTGSKKSSSSSSSSNNNNNKHNPNLQGENMAISGGSNNSSRASTPTNFAAHHKTPGNTPVASSTKIIDGTIPDHVMKKLAEVDAIGEGQEEEEESVAMDDVAADDSEAMMAPSPPRITSTAAAAVLPDPAVTAPPPVPSEDDMLRMAEAMALAVEHNPTKSHEEIRRMVLSQPEFQHLAPPESVNPASSTGASSSSSSSLKKSFMSLGNKFRDTALGGSVSSFSFGMVGGTNSTPTTGATAAPEEGEKQEIAGEESAVAPKEKEETTNTTTAASFTTNAKTTGAPSAPLPETIPESSAVNFESSVSTSNSLQGSSSSILATDQPQKSTQATPAVTFSEDKVAKATTAPAPAPPVQPLPPANKKPELPIKLTDIVWKRRSGFGKFSTSSAWERRRFVLQGNVLSYFRARPKGSSSDAAHDQHAMPDETERFDEEETTNMEGSGSGNNKSSSKSSTKRMVMDAWDYAAGWGLSSSAATAPAAPEKSSEGGSSSARGSMDLIKENATICATHGHSGAPSPFCLSIKVKGETKWKLCFASHRSQLQWLAAITDVIVQTSVDTYNVQLLTAADPSADPVAAAFQSHVHEPPAAGDSGARPRTATNESNNSQESQPTDAVDPDHLLLPQPSTMHVSGRRLWMMEPYVIRSQNDAPPTPTGVSKGKVAGEDTTESSYESDEDEDETEVAETKREEEDEQLVWSLPEKNLTLAAVIINTAILYARNSTMTAQGFWTVFTIANMTLFAFLEAAPRVKTDADKPPVIKKRRTKKRRGKGDARKDDKSGEQPKGDSAGVKTTKTKKKDKYVPLAGTTTVQVKKPEDPGENAKGETFSRWHAPPGETIQVRSHGYGTTKAKIASPGSLYELTQMDLFESPSRYPDMTPRVKLPSLKYEVDPSEVKSWKSPDHFVISLSLPTDPPKMGASTSDGGGYTITMYFTMRKETREILKRVTADGYNPTSEPTPDDVQKSIVNAVRLFEEWVRRAPNDVKFQTRFKMIPHVVNAKEVGLPSWIGKYNGKPLLIKRPGQTGFLFPHPELSAVEFDISLHVFPYLAKQGICYMKDSIFKKMIARVAFVIEGRDDDELPECIIGVGDVCYPDPAVSIQGKDFFAGTAPRSFEPAASDGQPKAKADTAHATAAKDQPKTQPVSG